MSCHCQKTETFASWIVHYRQFCWTRSTARTAGMTGLNYNSVRNTLKSNDNSDYNLKSSSSSPFIERDNSSQKQHKYEKQ